MSFVSLFMVQWNPPCPRPQLWAQPWQRGPPRGWTCGTWAPIASLTSHPRHMSPRSILTVRGTATFLQISRIVAPCLTSLVCRPPLSPKQRASSGLLAGRKPCRGPWTGRPRRPPATPTVRFKKRWFPNCFISWARNEECDVRENWRPCRMLSFFLFFFSPPWQQV